MQFLFPTLTVGFLLAAVPLLIHLINMLRHRRQPWAAMEFLLASYRRQRKWIWMRQLLLLAARTLVIVTLVAMLAGWISGGRFLDLFGGRVTHHVVILDDSYSMADVSGGRSAYSRGLAAIDGLYNRLIDAGGQNRFTLMRTSRADLVLRSENAAADRAAEFAGRTVVPSDRMLARVMASEPSASSAGPEAALQLAAGLQRATAADQTILYILSDFREREWEQPERIAETLKVLADRDVKIRLVDCVDSESANVGVTGLHPVPDVWAAGVPVACEVEVTNWGDQPLQNLTVSLDVIRYGSSVLQPEPEEPVSGAVRSLPEMVIEELPAGESVVRRFQVYITETGTHAIRARIPDDAVATDNVRYCSLPLSSGQRVLVVDGSPDETSSYLLTSALSPGSPINTGLIVETRPPAFLQSASATDLAEYQTVYLADLPAPDRPTALALAQYVRAGGGLVIFAGDQVRFESYNDAFGAGEEGLLPGELKTPIVFDSDRTEELPDLRFATADPITDPLRPAGDAVFRRVRVERALGIDPVRSGSRPATQLLTGPDGVPIVVARPFGAGRVLLVTTGLTQGWSTWPTDPSFVVFALRSAAVLGQAGARPTSSEVDEALVWTENEGEVSRTARFFPPADGARIGIMVQGEEQGQKLRFVVDPVQAAVESPETIDPLTRSGLAEMWISPLDGSVRSYPAARVVTGEEGNLNRASADFVANQMPGLGARLVTAQSLATSDQDAGLMNRAMLLLLLLVGLLIVEQLLAYWASYHPAASQSSAVAKGTA